MDASATVKESPAASRAAGAFASALAATPQWVAWEAAAERVHNDPAVQHASAVYEKRLEALRPRLMLRAASVEEEAELERLRVALFAEPPVVAYAQAEAALKALCSAAAERLSQQIGLDYAASCATGCCG